MVEPLTVNQVVAGSNPAGPVYYNQMYSYNCYYGTPVYIKDIDIADEQISVMVDYFETRRQYVGENNTYFGDKGNDTQILSLPQFECLIGPINDAVSEYLSSITQNSHFYESYIMKSWPIILEQNGGISKHYHHNSHLSVVYYLNDSLPEDEGNLTFHRRKDHDLRQIGIRFYDLNTDVSGSYVPVQAKRNRLVVFPSSVNHLVTEYLGTTPRYSISCDIVNVKVEGDLENTLTSPHSWVKL